MGSFLTLLFRLALILGFIVVVDLYAFQAVKAATRSLSERSRQIANVVYWLPSLLMLAGIVVSIIAAYYYREFNSRIGSYLLSAVVLLYLPKLVILAFLAGEDAYRAVRAGVQAVAPPAGGAQPYTRSEFLSRVSLGLAAIPFVSVAYGIVRGKYAYKLHQQELFFADLPAAFDGLKIVQLSDIHCGSFDNEEAVQHGIDLANAQGADVILFTGDIVNNRSDELDRWQGILGKLKAPMGVFSILGNHDYGDYVRWESPGDKVANLADLKARHGQMGFRLLLNEHVPLTRGTDSIALVGVENWGKPPFPQLGDLGRATTGLARDTFSILLSHDPSHWDLKVRQYPHPFHLTLSGHTHGMQLGIEIPGLRWSPVKYRYPRWAGLYEEAGKYLYVNRGFGFLGFSGRVGIWPEVTLLTLRRRA